MLLQLCRKIGLLREKVTAVRNRTRWHRYGAILRLEELENRLVPDATFVVNTLGEGVAKNPGDGTALDENGKISLRSAVTESNHTAGTTTIDLTHVSGTINLSVPLDDLAQVDILGPGKGNLTIAGGNGFRIFTFLNLNSVASISGVTLTGATTADRGGAISNDEGLTLSGVEINGCTASGGGAIYNDGELTASDLWLDFNTANNKGGGIYNRGTLNIASAQIYDNSAIEGGGIFDSWNASASTITADIYGNTASDQGAGLSIEATAGFTMNGGSIDNNISGGMAGGIYVKASAYGMTGTVTLSNVSIEGNQAQTNGGGYAVYKGTLALTNCTISGNTATTGPGGFRQPPGSVTTTDCNISDRLVAWGDQSDYNATGTGNGLLSQVVTDVPDWTSYAFTPVSIDGLDNNITINEVSSWIVAEYGTPTFTTAELVIYAADPSGGPDMSAPVYDATAAVSLTDLGSGANGETYQVTMSGLSISLSEGNYYLALAPVQDSSCLCYVLTTLSAYTQNAWWYNANYWSSPVPDYYMNGTGIPGDYAYQILGS